MERTLIIIKHDGVARGLIGQVLKRYERLGLKIVAMEFLQSTEDMGDGHYPNSEKWFRTVGERTLSEYKEKGKDPLKEFGSDDPLEIGKSVKRWLVEYLAIGPVLAFVLEGPGAVAIGRKIAGNTIPAKALPGTIRGDFGLDNVELANRHKRPIYNVLHASGEVAEAEEEIALWFGKGEIFSYETYSDSMLGVSGKIGQSK